MLEVNGGCKRRDTGRRERAFITSLTMDALWRCHAWPSGLRFTSGHCTKFRVDFCVDRVNKDVRLKHVMPRDTVGQVGDTLVQSIIL